MYGCRPEPSLDHQCLGDALGGLLWFVAEVIMAPMLSVEVFSTALGGVPLRCARLGTSSMAPRSAALPAQCSRGQVCIARLMSETLL